MTVLELHTNEGTRLVSNRNYTYMNKKMWEYIRAKRAQGMPLAEIIFCWGPRTVGTI